MKRYLETNILADLPEKIVLLSGPRQVGKTTLAKQLSTSYDYLNFDSLDHRSIVLKKNWDRKKQLIILDELHKMNEWKRWLKGIYDTEGVPPWLLVTGSARLDMHKRVGDSLAGRFFQYRLHPIDLKEATQLYNVTPDEAFEILWHCSGFPEPYLKANRQYYRRWRQSHIDIILRHDLLDIASVRDITSIETLVLLLKERIGSTISYANLARDLEVDATTVKRWLNLLENLYIIFKVQPHSKKVARSLLKEPKYYFYDPTYADDNLGARLENFVACAILKELHFIEDTTGHKMKLHYLRTKDGNEIDFLITADNKPIHLIEVKYSDDEPAKGFNYFNKFLKNTKQTQLVKELDRERTYPDGLEIRELVPWLASINLSPKFDQIVQLKLS